VQQKCGSPFAGTELAEEAPYARCVTRPHRIEEPGGIFHIATRSVEERRAFGTVADRWSFLGILSEIVDAYEWRCKSYCLMGSHYHLIVETPKPNLSLGMQQLNGTYAQRFNGRHGRRGHLFGSRFYSVLVKSEEHLLAALRYVARNPVKAGLCAQPTDWRWSSYRATIGLEPALRLLDVEGVLGLFGLRRHAAREQLARFVEGPHQPPSLSGAAMLAKLDGV
jgi:REP-associated tyrosine transposase